MVEGCTRKIRATFLLLMPSSTSPKACFAWVASNAARLPPIRPSRRALASPSFGPFANHLALKLGKAAQHLHHHPASRAGGFDVFSQAFELCPDLIRVVLRFAANRSA